ncbi:GNAT family N-acetyltransferase [Scleromatobacter humisilvae]|uniref:GNAT family N-acetyltransferase n=1 Tax=Scleromatobacter humisilvae TaxID=2897159 RepID=A0A9X2BXG8_9BURK|nr:GNAT family N-acetyltransferase [Scleromatobacter humisilvae]MCK9684407.1 GNAT family N-acetyltransferase [Scleromatobacter humisilvae]
MTANLRIAIEPPNNADVGVVMQQLTAYNASKAGGETPDYLFIAARDEDGTVRGGLVGATYLGWLSVTMVSMDESLRSQGHGAALMKLAEDEAVRRGCPRVFLETLSFQALPFYEKLGYEVHSKLEGFPPGGARYALTKML